MYYWASGYLDDHILIKLFFRFLNQLVFEQHKSGTGIELFLLIMASSTRLERIMQAKKNVQLGKR